MPAADLGRIHCLKDLRKRMTIAQCQQVSIEKTMAVEFLYKSSMVLGNLIVHAEAYAKADEVFRAYDSQQVRLDHLHDFIIEKLIHHLDFLAIDQCVEKEFDAHRL